MSHARLSEQDYQQLAATLQKLQAHGAMNLERLDGFFSALLCGPEAIKPAEVLPVILGEAFDDEAAFSSEKKLEKFVDLLTRHWLEVADTLISGSEFQPWFNEDEAGMVHGNDWAEGFASGMELLNDDWGLLFDDAEASEALVPILALAYERHPDPEMRSFIEAAGTPEREAWLAQISDSVAQIFQFFAALRAQMAEQLAEDEAMPATPSDRPLREGGAFKVESKAKGAAKPKNAPKRR